MQADLEKKEKENKKQKGDERMVSSSISYLIQGLKACILQLKIMSLGDLRIWKLCLICVQEP